MAKRYRQNKWIGKQVAVGLADGGRMATVVEQVNMQKLLVRMVGTDELMVVPKMDCHLPMSAAQQRMNALCPKCGNKKANCECLELDLLGQIKLAGIEEPVREFLFVEDRKFRADFAWPTRKILAEVDGGGYRSRHRERAGFEKDAEKTNLAALLGYRVLRFTTKQVKNGEALNMLSKVLIS